MIRQARSHIHLPGRNTGPSVSMRSCAPAPHLFFVRVLAVFAHLGIECADAPHERAHRGKGRQHQADLRAFGRFRVHPYGIHILRATNAVDQR